MSAVGNAVLDAVDVMQTSETVWAYPDNVTITPLLGRHRSSVGNAVLQSSALTLLTKTIGFTTDDRADAEALLALRYAGTEITYIDPDGETYTVIITSLSFQRTGGDLYTCSATLIQPPSAGS